MDETILWPSPNWFVASNFAVSRDGWIIYGSASKSITALVPRTPGEGFIAGKYTYQAHVVPRAHPERVVSVDISPEFSIKRNFISGSADGSVKHWILENVNDKYKFKATLSHEVHHNDKEEIVGVAFSTESIAITVGETGRIVKWDLHTNVCKPYTKLTSFRATCMSCSPHIPLNVAVGTKQGVVFVMDLEGNGKVVYKIRSQDDEITALSWCPQFEVLVNKSLKVVEKKSFATSRMEAIRNEPEKENILEQSGIIKKLPEDSFDETVVEEDDMFDIYKDHEADEFGHKKYEPEDILVKVKAEKKEDNDYLAECLKLKEEILKRKNQEEQSIESLVEAMDKAHVDNSCKAQSSDSHAGTSAVSGERTSADSSVHVQKHLLATIGRFGAVRIWSKAGKLLASCAIACSPKTSKAKVQSWPTLLWYKPDTLLMVDAKNQLLECNPLIVDSKNKVQWRVVHALHKRGLFALATDAPRVCAGDACAEHSVWSVAQDRSVVRYCLATRRALAVHHTCGGFLYNVQPCPYDAARIAVSVGDGAIRVCQMSTTPEDDSQLSAPTVHTYWHNVQGKVLTVAWHPTKENLLAFGTAESRVGVLDTGGRGERAARVLFPALAGGVYSLSWADGTRLLAAAGDELVCYDANSTEPPVPVEVQVEGQRWRVGAAAWSARGLLCGSQLGAVAVLHPHTYQVEAVAFVFNKMIHSLEWHPEQTSGSSELSPLAHLVAVSSLDKSCNVAILEYKDKENGGGKQLSTWKLLSGHALPVLQLAWSPHRDELLLSTSQDTTVRVWDVVEGTCVSVFTGHSQHSLGAAWSAWPQLRGAVLSGGGDYCLRLWDYTRHAHAHAPNTQLKIKHETSTKTKKKTDKKKQEATSEEGEVDTAATPEGEKVKREDLQPAEELQVAAPEEATRKPSKKFILPLLHRRTNPCPLGAVRAMLRRHLAAQHGDQLPEPSHGDDEDERFDFLKIFGSINELNEFLDLEASRLEAEGQTEAWVSLALVRGRVADALHFAARRHALAAHLLAHAPGVSLKFWKDATQLYIAQLDRMIARGVEDKPEQRHFGGAVYRKATALLSVHDARAAAAALAHSKLHKEAYVLCRTRYMDSVAQEMLGEWARHSGASGNMRLAALCYIALGKLSEAATVLAKYSDQESLNLAAQIAKAAGRNVFADHMEQKAQTAVVWPKQDTIQDLPTRAELRLMDKQEVGQGDPQTGSEGVEHDIKTEHSEVNDNAELNGDVSASKLDL